MSHHNNAIKETPVVTPPQTRVKRRPEAFRGSRGPVMAFAFGLLVLSLAVLVAALLLWWPAVASAGASTRDNLTWLQDVAPLALLATATPAPAPTPTLAPAEVAMQFAPQLRTALSVGNWDHALETVAIISAIDPSGEEVRYWAFTTAMQYGQALVEGGRVDDAQFQFDQAVTLAPVNAEAHLWRRTTEIYRAGRDAVENEQWEAALESLTLAEEQIPGYGEVSSLLVEAYRGQGEAALAGRDWALALEALTLLRERTPKDAAVLGLLSQAYSGQARAAMSDGNWPTAIDTLIEARERLPGDQNLPGLLSLAYRGQGEAAMAQKEWTEAVETLTEGLEQLPGDQKVSDLLASAYLQRGIALQERGTRNTRSIDTGTLREARADLKEAMSLQPGITQAKAHLKEIENLLNPTKRIEVDISEQRLYAWEGDKLIYKFPVSTGLRGQDTSTGRFQILDKIPMAYSRIWRLKMPNWMGIYWVQGIENGIHGLPYRPDGSKMWAGLLGQRASYGCIVLGTKQAKTLYEWAEIGTRVDIHN